MKVILEFQNSHHYVKEYKHTQWHCPRCGKKTVWEDQDIGDYYEGSDLCCTSCYNRFTMPSHGTPPSAYLSVIKQLELGIPIVPSTRLGG